MNDPWISTLQSPECIGPGLGPGIRPRVDTINPGPEKKSTIIREQFLVFFILSCTTFQFRFVCILFGLFCSSDTNTPRRCSTKKKVAATTSHFRLPLPVAGRISRENGCASLTPSNVGHSVPPPSYPVRPSHPASRKPVSPIILSSA